VKLLVVAYYHPPINSGGTHQGPVKFAKHLRRRGHRVTILAPWYGTPPADEADLLRVPDPSYNCQRSGVGLVRWSALRLAVELLNLGGMPASIYSLWRRRALASIQQIRAEADPEVVVATYPPLEDLEIGLGVASALGVPLVADFRDGILFEPVEKRRMARHSCVRRYYRTVETAVAERASAMLAAFPSLTRYLTDEYGVDTAVTLPNGFDPEDLGEAEGTWSFDPDHFNLVHTGRFGGSDIDRDVSPLCAAIEDLVADRPELGDRLRLHLVGPLARRERRRFSGLITRGVVVCHGLVPLPAALAGQRAADSLLLMTSMERFGHAPGKLYEYLHSGRPIVGLTPPGSYCESLIRETGSGVVADPRDPSAIAELLHRIVSDPSAIQGVRRDQAAIATFDRKHQAVEFERILHSVVAPPG
jgi:glycosyltransferase involved in cell wall biosynthesis